MSRNDVCATSFVFAALIAAGSLRGQTTQGLISGVVSDAVNGARIATAHVQCINAATQDSAAADTDKEGRFFLPSLSPGQYYIRISASDYQPREIDELNLNVAARLEVNFRLVKLADLHAPASRFALDGDVIIHYYTTDVESVQPVGIQSTPSDASPLQPSVSQVVQGVQLGEVPLAGRDVYTLIATEAGVVTGASSPRGIGVAIDGQRPASSNFLLDGIENNNGYLTGPLTALAPEAIQEYRVSINSWSAEYGGTAGYIANAVTRSGGTAWHGVTYFNLKNDALNANTFDRNWQGLGRSPFKENQYGFEAGGPLWPHKKLFVSLAFDGYRSRGYGDSQTVELPSPLLAGSLSPGNPAIGLLNAFPTPATTPGDGSVAQSLVRPTVSTNRYLGLARTDYVSSSGRSRLMLRLIVNNFTWPDFIWYPYKEFMSGLDEPLTGVVVGYSAQIRPGVTHELRAGLNRSTIRWDRPHPEIPTLQAGGVDLPGSPLEYGFRDTTGNLEVNDNWLWVRGSHLLKAGGGLQVRHENGLLSIAQAGEVIFDTFGDFKADSPLQYRIALDRTALPGTLKIPDPERSYRDTQYSFFAEDIWRMSRRLTVDTGVRYENFGAPVNIGQVKDTQVQLGSGADFPSRLATARLVTPGAGNQTEWNPDNTGLAGRFGLAWDGESLGLPVIRAAYGIFYDRPFGNLWLNVRNNSAVVPPGIDCDTNGLGPSHSICGPVSGRFVNYLAPAQAVLAAVQSGNSEAIPAAFPSLTLIDPNLRNGYAQDYFVSAERRIAKEWEAEVNTLGSLGRRLITTDLVNRPFSIGGRPYNSALPEIEWRSNQGSSEYNAMTASVRYRARNAFLQAAWTWSHTIDNQSDPLAKQPFDLSFTNFTQRGVAAQPSTFARQFDSSADRGNADFDQRHTLVVQGYWAPPPVTGTRLLRALTSGWHVGELASFRTGFPFSVYAASSGSLANQRANLILPNAAYAIPPGTPEPPGGTLLLNSAAFAQPADGILGTSGRNAFRGPGAWNVDLSVSRTLRMARLGETRSLTIRADFFNAFNHANLNPPDSSITSTTFGQATYGSVPRDTGFPALVPFTETARQVQMILKLEF